MRRATSSHAGRAVRGAVPRALPRRPARRSSACRSCSCCRWCWRRVWFGVRGAVLMALRGGALLLRQRGAGPVGRGRVVHGAGRRRSCGRFGLAVAGVFVAVLFERQVKITRELDELEATRDALRPSAIAPRPALDLAAHYVPVQDGVGGDFYLAVEGPRGSTVLVVGDVVGKGVTAAQRAVFVRTSLVTFAPFEDDPARLLQLANAALIDRAGTSVDYVTAACVVHRPADGTLAWALAGHHAPLALGLGPRARPGRRGPAARARPRPRCHRRDHSAQRGRRRAALHGRDPRRARRARRALRRGAAERAGRRIFRRDRRGRGRAPAASRSPTSRRPPATTSACSRRATTRSADWRQEAAPVGSGRAG